MPATLGITKIGERGPFVDLKIEHALHCNIIIGGLTGPLKISRYLAVF
ncbi:MAG: hypothetical protein QXN93_01045 [Methanomassiliicoccales archaeon]